MTSDTIEEATVGYEDVFEAIRGGSVRPLEDLHNVESALSLIRDARRQIDDFKELKKKRANAIDEKVESLKGQVEFLSNVVSETLKNSNEKTVRFPGIGKVTRRQVKGKWVIDSDDDLFTVLKKEDEFDNIVEMKPSIKKKELNKLLDTWSKIDKVPDCVKREEDSEGLTFSFEDERQNETPDIDNIPFPKKQSLSDLEI